MHGRPIQRFLGEEFVHERSRLRRHAPRAKPPDHAFLRVHPRVQSEHGLMKFNVHEHFPIAIVARNRVRRARDDENATVRRRRRRPEHRADHLVHRLTASHVAVRSRSVDDRQSHRSRARHRVRARRATSLSRRFHVRRNF